MIKKEFVEISKEQEKKRVAADPSKVASIAKRLSTKYGDALARLGAGSDPEEEREQ